MVQHGPDVISASAELATHQPAPVAAAEVTHIVLIEIRSAGNNNQRGWICDGIRATSFLNNRLKRMTMTGSQTCGLGSPSRCNRDQCSRRESQSWQPG